MRFFIDIKHYGLLVGFATLLIMTLTNCGQPSNPKVARIKWVFPKSQNELLVWHEDNSINTLELQDGQFRTKEDYISVDRQPGTLVFQSKANLYYFGTNGLYVLNMVDMKEHFLFVPPSDFLADANEKYIVFLKSLRSILIYSGAMEYGLICNPIVPEGEFIHDAVLLDSYLIAVSAISDVPADELAKKGLVLDFYEMRNNEDMTLVKSVRVNGNRLSWVVSGGDKLIALIDGEISVYNTQGAIMFKRAIIDSGNALGRSTLPEKHDSNNIVFGIIEVSPMGEANNYIIHITQANDIYDIRKIEISGNLWGLVYIGGKYVWINAQGNLVIY